MKINLHHESAHERAAKTLELIARGNFAHRYEAMSEREATLEKAIDQIAGNLKNVVRHINLIAQGRYDIDFVPLGDDDELGVAVSEMTAMLREMSVENKRSAWIKSGQAELLNIIRGDQSCHELGKNILSFLARYINAMVGTIYQVAIDQSETLELIGSFAIQRSKDDRTRIKFGEGLIGQCALEKEQIIFRDVPSHYLTISSSLGEASPKHIVVIPFLIEKEVVGVMELGALDAFSATQLELLAQVSENIAIALKSSQNSEKLRVLLSKQPTISSCSP